MNILDQELLLEFFRSNFEIFIGLLFLGTFGLTFYLIPKVLWVSKEKNLTARVEDRSSHTVATPSFGGVAFFITLILVLTLIQSMRLTYVGNHLIAAITILFMVGLKDDLIISTARVKLIGQITAALFLIFSPELQLTNLYGFLGIYELHDLFGYLFKAFIVLALINSYNLIDGIDGLAALVGIVISLVFAGVFYLTAEAYFVLVSISLAGILSGFLRFNFSRGRSKIFMGDSGSLVVGLVLSFLSLKFLVMKPNPELVAAGFAPVNRLLFLACVLFIPAFDTLRVVLVRIKNRSGPFSPDKNHVHHVLLNLGLSHKKASFALAFLNIIIIGTFYYFSNILSHVSLIGLVSSMYVGCFFLFGKLRAVGERRLKTSELTVKEGVQTKIEEVS